ncbi:MAG: aspartate aminotransferase family protein [Myxococcales bacterium]|nr:aspartate aminotransferase family protein [Myxococcales bacterium]
MPSAHETRRTIPGQRSLALVERLSLSECPSLTSRRKRRTEQSGSSHDPIVWHHASGTCVTDVDGQTFTDLTASFGTAALGHCHPAIRAALDEQLGLLWQGLGDLHPSLPKVLLLERLADMAPWPQARVILGLSGSDSIEAALKTALLATGKPGILAFQGGYHGLSYGVLSACGYKSAFRQPFLEQINREVHFAPYPHARSSIKETLEALEERWNPNIGAVIVEPIQARGGVNVPPSDFLPSLHQWCQLHDVVLIADEVYTGIGRCGALWLSAEQSVHVDLICVGKALGGGIPISACLGRLDLMQAWGASHNEALHTSTFAGYPLGCRAALATLDIIEKESLIERSREVGRIAIDALRERLGDHKRISDIRGRGLLIGIELTEAQAALTVQQTLLAAGFITLVAGVDTRVIQISPPLNIETALMTENFGNALERALETP